MSLARGDDLDIDNSGGVFSDDVDDEFADASDVDYGTAEHVRSLLDFHEVDESAPDLDDGSECRSEDALPRYQLQGMLRDDAAVL